MATPEPTTGPTTEPTTSPTTTSPTTTTTTTTTTSTTTSDTDTDTTTTTTSPTTTTTSPTTTSTTTTTTSTTTTTPTSTSTPATTTTTTTPPPVIVTSTSTTSISQTRSIAPTQNNNESEGGTPFFQNTGAVAGTFTAVGVVGLIILIVIITTTIRRRRAKKFDQEIAEAAREAAATQPPVFLDDDDDYRSGGTYGGAGSYGIAKGPYSDVSSHGTYQQSPMSHAESYGMREIPPSHGPAPGEVFDYSAAAGNAGIGVARARSQRDGGSYGQALQDGASPYPAFMPPTTNSPPPVHPYGRDYSARGHELEVLEAAGLGTHVAGAGASLARGPSQYQGQQSQPQQQDYEGLTRNKSLVSHEGEIVYPTTAPTGQSQYYSASADPYAGYNMPQQQQQPQYPSPYPAQQYQQDDDDAYGGYVVQDEPQSRSPGMPNPYDNAPQPGYPQQPQARDDGYGSADDDEPRRVLKVANQ